MMYATIKTALAVRSAMTGDVECTGQSRAVSRIYTRLDSGGHGILGACRSLGLCKSESPIVVIEMLQGEHGFGFAYVHLCGDGCPRILIAGLLDDGFDLPMPTPPLGVGSIAIMRAGIIETPHTIADIFGPIVENSDEVDFQQLRPGWDLDVDAIIRGSARVPAYDPYKSLYHDFEPGGN